MGSLLGLTFFLLYQSTQFHLSLANTCPQGFGNSFGLSLYEDGTIKNEGDDRISKDNFIAKPIIITDDLKDYFEINDETTEWVLKAKNQSWYDTDSSDKPRPNTITIEYTCGSVADTTVPQQLFVIGQNSETPQFDKAVYSGKVSQQMPLNLWLDFYDPDLSITATDTDYVCDKTTDNNCVCDGANCKDEESSNEITCETQEGEEYFECIT